MTPAIQISDLLTQIEGRTLHHGLNLTILPGEIVGLVGETGGGKSVLIETLVGLRKPTAGSVRIFGRELTSSDGGAIEFAQDWGILFQSGALFSNMTVLENVSFVLRNHTELPTEIINGIAATKIRMSGLAQESHGLKASELSGGMRKRAALARALALDPRLLILDEPTAGLDAVEASNIDVLIHDLSRSLGAAALVVTHDLDTLYAICDRVAVLADKKIIAVGRIDEVSKHPHPWIESYFSGKRGTAALKAHARNLKRSREATSP